MGSKGFKGLNVWQKAKDLAVFLYKVAGSGEFARDYGLRDQIRRAGVSIASNIAEGDERETDKEAIRYFYIAKGSCAEVLTQAIISWEVGHIDKDSFSQIEGRCKEISGMLARLIAARSKS